MNHPDSHHQPEADLDTNHEIAAGSDEFPGNVVVTKVKWYTSFIPSRELAGTTTIVILNVVAFILATIRGAHILIPDPETILLLGGNIRMLTLENEYWRLFTSIFLHYGIIHLVFNMAALIFIGARLEKLTGTFHFVCMYLLTGLIASATSVVWNVHAVAAGASGAIFGMFGLYLGILLSDTVHIENKSANLRYMSIFIAMEVASGFRLSIVDNAAHLGGLISGLLAGWIAGSYFTNNNSGKNRYVVGLISMATTVLIVWICMAITPNTIKIYEEKMSTFETRDREAVAILNAGGYDKEETLYQLNERAVYYVEENMKLLQELKKIDLPPYIEKRNEKLMEYSQLRIESFQLYSKAIESESTQFAGQIEEIEHKIEKCMEDLQ